MHSGGGDADHEIVVVTCVWRSSLFPCSCTMGHERASVTVVFAQIPEFVHVKVDLAS